MAKKIIVIVAIIISVSVGVIFTTIAQNESQIPTDASEKISQLELKINKMYSDLENNDRDILKKLDTVLSNQDKILKEVEIVKVRASIHK